MQKCTICFSDNPNCKSKCNHYFCKSCILTWLNIKHNCPLCRSYLNEYLLEDINCKNNYSLRSKTYNKRRIYIINATNFYLVKFKSINYTPKIWKINNFGNTILVINHNLELRVQPTLIQFLNEALSNYLKLITKEGTFNDIKFEPDYSYYNNFYNKIGRAHV